ncbi:hypothetical protein QVD17_18438 [Tagetes erecta]|uniref:Band 7 domain-containing protein n=1 Tax=Tagetes erecta TaxID=13708 RepID=A0AAD8KKG6_TARER|nr:hypothetical protein QVD17_18438 [Tagetes erecta]
MDAEAQPPLQPQPPVEPPLQRQPPVEPPLQRQPPVEPPLRGYGDFTVTVPVVIAAIVIFFTNQNSSAIHLFLITNITAVRTCSDLKIIANISQSVLIPSSTPSLKSSFTILHQVPEGHVGVYWLGGALQKTTTTPGFHLKLPLVTHYEPVQVTLQTDLVRDIPCGTKGGVMINFDRIEVVNRLKKEYVYKTLLNYGVKYDHTWIYDKIHHEINQFCSVHSLQDVYIDMFDQIGETMKEALQADCTRYAPGIEIISVRVTKPKIPVIVRRNFEQMEEERTKVLVSIEKQRVAEKEAETQKKIAITEAEKHAYVSKIVMEQKLMEKDGLRMQEEISNAMYMAREKSLTDAKLYQTIKEAEANKLMLTPQFLELKFYEAISKNTKLFFGEKISSMVLDQKLHGNYFQDLERKNLEA